MIIGKVDVLLLVAIISSAINLSGYGGLVTG